MKIIAARTAPDGTLFVERCPIGRKYCERQDGAARIWCTDLLEFDRTENVIRCLDTGAPIDD